MTFPGRDSLEADALRTDRYLDALLAAHDQRAADVPADAGLGAEIRNAANRLSRDLVRVHPSFRFEERLAARLAELAAAMRLPAAAGGEGAPIPFAPGGADPAFAAADLLDPADRGGPIPPLPRPLLIGGALTSAALSLAGAAYVAWRRSRPPASPMARAVRAARHARHGLRAGVLPAPGRRLD